MKSKTISHNTNLNSTEFYKKLKFVKSRVKVLTQKLDGINYTLLFLTITLLIITTNCSNEKESTKEQIKSSARIISDTVFATGSATSADLQIAIDKAKVMALNKIGNQIKVQFQDLREEFFQGYEFEIDSSLSEELNLFEDSFVSLTLSKYKIHKQEFKKQGNRYNATLEVEAPIANIRDVFIDEIQTNDKLVTRLKVHPNYSDFIKERSSEQK